MEKKKIYRAFYFGGSLLLTLWFILLLDSVFKLELYRFGIYPGSWVGVIGIFTSPFIHGGAEHLISNSLSTFILIAALRYYYHSSFYKILFIQMVITGVFVWFWARPAYHVGFSGLIYAVSFFFLFQGFWNTRKEQLAMAFVVLIIQWGGLFTGLVDNTDNVSWEAHVFGALSGLVSGFVFRNLQGYISEEITGQENEQSVHLVEEPEHDNIKIKVFFPHSEKEK